MAIEEHLKILKKGVEEWNEWRSERLGVRPNFRVAYFSGADLRYAKLWNSNFSGANLSRANLNSVDLRNAKLRRANLSSADLRGANLRAADLRGSNLSGANLSKANLNSAALSHAALSSASLTNADLSLANLIEVDLIRADLSGAKLSGADLSGAKLSNAILSAVDLSNANLSGSNLNGANLNGANFRGANLRGAKLNSADLSGAVMQSTTLASLDLRQVYRIETVDHFGKSDLATSTLAKSKGQIPEVFLRGCGLQDWEIAAAKLHDPALTSEQVIDLTYEVARIKSESPIQINPIFISYSRMDSDFVEALEPRLDKKRIRYWRDVHDLKAGRLETQIDRAIRQNPIVLLVLSEASTESDWVEWEITKARELERDQERDVLCPIALDDNWKSCRWEGPLRRQVEKYNILDFSKWKNEGAMATAFQKLIDGLGLFYPNANTGEDCP